MLLNVRSALAGYLLLAEHKNLRETGGVKQQ